MSPKVTHNLLYLIIGVIALIAIAGVHEKLLKVM